MEPNNIENEFKQKLNAREIKPSAMAWDRLDAMLTVAEQKKPARKFNWLLIAASFLGFLLVGTFVWDRTEITPNPKNSIVLDQQQIKKADTDVEIMPQPNNDAIATTNPESNTKPSKSPKSTQFQSVNQTSGHHQSANTFEPTVENQVVLNESYPQVDELLATAQAKTPDNTKSVVTVNPKALLSRVDGEASLSLRQKVIQQVGKNYQNVKVALSNRNLEEENH